ncbi:MAG TPA: DNA methyltransferase [Thermosynechococcaceae cyanobacterium]
MGKLTSLRDGRQLCLFETQETTQLDEWLWCQSFDRQESTLHSLAPYAHRSSAGLVQALVELYSQPGEIVLDPFAGSGTVAFETLTIDRVAWAADQSPYACAVAEGKLAAPRSERMALRQAAILLEAIDQAASRVDLDAVPNWVRDFFHPETLRETVAAFQVLQQQPNEFLSACLVGILHHVLPGYLSYPSNASAPYLRRFTYPPADFPHLYAYRDVRSRLLAKIKRTYRRHRLPTSWQQRRYRVWQSDCAELAITDNAVDAIVTQPPHAEAFESAQNHRLRLWFLGCLEWQAVDAAQLSSRNYGSQITPCLQEMARVLKPDRPCVLMVRDVLQHGKTRGMAETLANLATATGCWRVEIIYDRLPIDQTARSSLKPVKFDRVLVLRKLR